ncbi:uncharacterized protein LY89DRAFT_681438 [Mollisia scopiformis]|uniref:Uncharacterized protein n=1 Tax=Mollisia scopiformis TaxID=149040 RepID=A0A194XPJ7_MOLSC|nr:uncharacterized protein LY89DRAFT_681438 [Mollisia scopiformis]KUJ22113.1 hypothetical protein LY89DRAFT_681438 [Mollisia scopiformis]
MLQQEFSDSPNEAVGEEGEKRKWVSDIRGQVEAILYHLEVAGRREERHRKREERDDMLDEQRNRVDDWLESITVSGADPNSSG